MMEKHITVLAQDDEDAARLARGVKAWWRRLATPLRAAIIVVPTLLTLGGAGYFLGDVRADVSGHELRLQSIERTQAARTAAEAEKVKAAAAVERKVDQLGAKVDAMRAEQSSQGGKLDVILRRLP